MTSGVKEDRANVIAIGADDTLLDVFDRVRAAGQSPVELSIPNESSLFLTAAEFRTLCDVADHGRHAVTIRTPDPLRLRLAKLFGLDVVLVAPPAKQRTTGDSSSVADTNPGDPPNNQPKSQVAGLAEHEDPAIEASPDAISATEAAARWPDEPVVLRPVPSAPGRLRDRVSAAMATYRRQPASPPETDEGAGEAELAAAPDVATEPAGAGAGTSGDEAPDRIHWVGDRRRVSPLVIVGVALFVVLVAVTAANFLLPSAVVSLELASVPINSELVFDVTTSGQPFDDDAAFALEGTPATVTVVFEASVPTTGVKAIPDEVASGMVRLANPTASEQTVEAGTILTTENGTEFRVVEPVVVPAADPATRAAGRAEATIQAVDPGTTGNVETGLIGGRLPNGVYYSNRQGPTAGGTDREVQTVAQVDLDTLMQMADAELANLVEAELQAGAGTSGDPAIVVPTLTVLESEETFDQGPGAEAETVRLRAERTVSVLTYDEAVAAERLASELGEQLQRTLPEGFRLGPVALAPDDVSVVEGNAEGARLRVSAAADAELVLTDAKRAELAQQLAGKSEEEAASILSGMPEVASFEIEPGFRLFSSNLPANAGRIEIIDGA